MGFVDIRVQTDEAGKIRDGLSWTEECVLSLKMKYHHKMGESTVNEKVVSVRRCLWNRCGLKRKSSAFSMIVSPAGVSPAKLTNCLTQVYSVYPFISLTEQKVACRWYTHIEGRNIESAKISLTPPTLTAAYSFEHPLSKFIPDPKELENDLNERFGRETGHLAVDYVVGCDEVDREGSSRKVVFSWMGRKWFGDRLNCIFWETDSRKLPDCVFLGAGSRRVWSTGVCWVSWTLFRRRVETSLLESGDNTDDAALPFPGEERESWIWMK